MSGYLQRLVSNARTPGTAVRPLLGSLYSYSPSHGMDVGLHEVEETVASGQSSAIATPDPPPSQTIPASPESRSLQPAISHSLPGMNTLQAATSGSGVEASRANQESVSGAQLEGPGPAKETGTAFTPLAAEFRVGVMMRRAENNWRSLETPSQQAIPQEPSKPLAPEVPRPAEAAFLENTSPPAPDRRGFGRALPARHATRVERDAEDIQIHIGRIEVTAVPPAPARPVVQPARKSLRLDEYLRRGREGAR